MVKLVGVARVSTTGQAGVDGEGLERQRIAIRGIIERTPGADLIDVVDIINVSGRSVTDSSKWRDVVLPLLNDPDTHLAVDAIDRIARGSTAAIDACKATGTKIYTPTAVYDLSTGQGVLLSGIFAAVGGFELEEIKRRMMAGKERRRREGRWVLPLAFLPTGISYDPDTYQWGYTSDARRVKLAFQLFVEQGIDNLSEVGRKCGGVQSQGVKAWLRNEIYKGLLVYDQKRGGKTYKKRGGKGRPDREKVRRLPQDILRVRVFSPEDQLVSDDIWRRAQALLRDKAKVVRKRRERSRESVPYSSFLFSADEVGGFLKSKLEGVVTLGLSKPDRHVLYGRTAPGKLAYYACRCRHTDPGAPNEKCNVGYLRCDEVNRAIDSLLSRIVSEEWFVDAMKASFEEGQRGVTATQITALETKLSEAMEQESKLVDLYLGGEVSKGIYSAKRKKLQDNKTNIERQLEELRSREEPDVGAITAHIRSLTFDPGWDAQRKRAWLRKNVRGIKVSHEGVESVAIRLPVTSGGTPSFTAVHSISWHELLGRKFGDLGGRKPPDGCYFTSEVAAKFGLTQGNLRKKMQDGIIPKPDQKDGNYHIWTDKDVDRARRALREREKALDGVYRPGQERYSPMELADALGIKRNRLKHLLKHGRLVESGRTPAGHRFWTPEDLQALIDAEVK